MSENAEKIPTLEMTEEEWFAQKLVGPELRKLRETSGMTQEELAQKMGPSYTAELVAQYEDGGVVPMEIWPIFDMIRVLGGSMNDLDPDRILGKRLADNGYADLSEESRAFVDQIVDTLAQGQTKKPHQPASV